MINLTGARAIAAKKSEPPTADHALALGVHERDPVALHDFLLRFRPAVYRYLWQASGSREDAEDLASQSLLTAARDIGHFRRDGPLQAWVFRVAHREFLRHRRREKLRRLFNHREVTHHATRPPDDYLVVSEALAKVPPDQRSAFLLTEVEGLTIDEAAVVLGVPSGTVKSRCHYAKQRLRSLLAPTYQENLK